MEAPGQRRFLRTLPPADLAAEARGEGWADLNFEGDDFMAVASRLRLRSRFGSRRWVRDQGAGRRRDEAALRRRRLGARAVAARPATWRSSSSGLLAFREMDSAEGLRRGLGGVGFTKELPARLARSTADASHLPGCASGHGPCTRDRNRRGGRGGLRIRMVPGFPET